MSDSAFTAEVDRLIAAALTPRPLRFAALLGVLPGVDPNFVRARLEAAPTPVRERVEWVPADNASAPLDRHLPVPHPLDFDWRFAPKTREALVHRLASLGSHVLLLGAPSVWLALREGQSPHQDVTLIDRSSFTGLEPRNRVRHVVADIFTDVVTDLTSPASVAMADPPWYPEATAHFVWTAARHSRLGSYLLLSVPPMGTRPGIVAEREELLAFAERVGYTLRETHASSLAYVMPPFERNALKAAGLAEFVPWDWRRGDLLVFERTGEVDGGRPQSPRAENNWVERVVDGVRFRVSLQGDRGTDPRLLSLVHGDILPTVSRRDPRRARVCLWTSGNRVFDCAAPSVLLSILGDRGRREYGAIPTEWIDKTHDEIKTIVEREREEYVCSEHA